MPLFATMISLEKCVAGLYHFTGPARPARYFFACAEGAE